MVHRDSLLLAGGLAALLTASPALAEEHIFSYDPVSDAARGLTQTGLSFQFERRLMGGMKIEKIIQTGERGSADLERASESELGAGGLKAALGGQSPAGGLYRIAKGREDGDAFVNAVCPGADSAWLVIGPLRRFNDLTIQAVGRDKGAAAARACAVLTFSFKSDWRLPERAPPRARFGGGNLPG